MSIRIILTPLFGDDADAAAAQAAFAVTRRFDAHVEGLFARIDPLDTIPIVGEGVSPTVMDDLTRAAQVEMDKRASAARAHFEAARASAGVEIAEGPPAPGGTSARWSEVTGRREEVIPRKARVSDLVVFGAQPSDSPELGGAIETTLLAAGRPLLLAPEGRADDRRAGRDRLERQCRSGARAGLCPAVRRGGERGARAYRRDLAHPVRGDQGSRRLSRMARHHVRASGDRGRATMSARRCCRRRARPAPTSW